MKGALFMTREKLEYLIKLSNTIDNLKFVIEMLEHSHIVISRYESDGKHDYALSTIDNEYKFIKDLILDTLKKKLQESQEKFEKGE